jgi:hypothetical protein
MSSNNHATQALLHLLLKLSESVTRLEALLLIASPEQDDVGSGVTSLRIPAHLSNVEESTEDRQDHSRNPKSSILIMKSPGPA